MLITTKFIGPTDTKGSRYKATALVGERWGAKTTVTLSTDFSVGSFENHELAALALARKINAAGWTPRGMELATVELVGETHDERGYAFHGIRVSGSRGAVAV